MAHKALSSSTTKSRDSINNYDVAIKAQTAEREVIRGKLDSVIQRRTELAKNYVHSRDKKENRRLNSQRKNLLQRIQSVNRVISGYRSKINRLEQRVSRRRGDVGSVAPRINKDGLMVSTPRPVVSKSLLNKGSNVVLSPASGKYVPVSSLSKKQLLSRDPVLRQEVGNKIVSDLNASAIRVNQRSSTVFAASKRGGGSVFTSGGVPAVRGVPSGNLVFIPAPLKQPVVSGGTPTRLGGGYFIIPPKGERVFKKREGTISPSPQFGGSISFVEGSKRFETLGDIKQVREFYSGLNFGFSNPAEALRTSKDEPLTFRSKTQELGVQIALGANFYVPKGAGLAVGKGVQLGLRATATRFGVRGVKYAKKGLSVTTAAAFIFEAYRISKKPKGRLERSQEIFKSAVNLAGFSAGFSKVPMGIRVSGKNIKPTGATQKQTFFFGEQKAESVTGAITPARAEVNFFGKKMFVPVEVNTAIATSKQPSGLIKVGVEQVTPVRIKKGKLDLTIPFQRSYRGSISPSGITSLRGVKGTQEIIILAPKKVAASKRGFSGRIPRANIRVVTNNMPKLKGEPSKPLFTKSVALQEGVVIPKLGEPQQFVSVEKLESSPEFNTINIGRRGTLISGGKKAKYSLLYNTFGTEPRSSVSSNARTVQETISSRDARTFVEGLGIKKQPSSGIPKSKVSKKLSRKERIRKVKMEKIISEEKPAWQQPIISQKRGIVNLGDLVSGKKVSKKPIKPFENKNNDQLLILEKPKSSVKTTKRSSGSRTTENIFFSKTKVNIYGRVPEIGFKFAGSKSGAGLGSGFLFSGAVFGGSISRRLKAPSIGLPTSKPLKSIHPLMIRKKLPSKQFIDNPFSSSTMFSVVQSPRQEQFQEPQQFQLQKQSFIFPQLMNPSGINKPPKRTVEAPIIPFGFVLPNFGLGSGKGKRKGKRKGQKFRPAPSLVSLGSGVKGFTGTTKVSETSVLTGFEIRT